MIAKLHKGADPGRLLAYLYDTKHQTTERHENPRMIAGSLIARDTPAGVAREMRELAATNAAIAKPIFHASLRVPAEESGRLDDAQWSAVAETYADRMGFGNAGWVAIRHADDHIHFAACRVDFAGRTVSDSHDWSRAMKACREIEAQHGLSRPDEHRPGRSSTLTRGERALHARQRAEGHPQGRQEPQRVQLRAVMERARDRATSQEDFERRCQRQGVLLRPNIASTGRMNGYAATLDGWRDKEGEQVWLTASKVHRELSWSRLGPLLERDREHERDRGLER